MGSSQGSASRSNSPMVLLSLERRLSTVRVNGVPVNGKDLSLTLPKNMNTLRALPPALESIRGLCVVRGIIA